MKPKTLKIFFPLVAGLLVVLHCAPKYEFTVLIKMMSNQEKYFREQVIPKFEEKERCKITVVNFEDMWEVSNLIKKYPKVALVKTPFEITRELIGKDFEDFDYYRHSVYRDASVLDEDVLNRIRKRAVLGFYLRPRQLWRLARQALRPIGFKKLLLKAKRL